MSGQGGCEIADVAADHVACIDIVGGPAGRDVRTWSRARRRALARDRREAAAVAAAEGTGVGPTGAWLGRGAVGPARCGRGRRARRDRRRDDAAPGERRATKESPPGEVNREERGSGGLSLAAGDVGRHHQRARRDLGVEGHQQVPPLDATGHWLRAATFPWPARYRAARRVRRDEGPLGGCRSARERSRHVLATGRPRRSTQGRRPRRREAANRRELREHIDRLRAEPGSK